MTRATITKPQIVRNRFVYGRGSGAPTCPLIDESDDDRDVAVDQGSDKVVM